MSDPNLITKAAFAIRCGVSKAAITKACTAERIGIKDRKVNLADPDTIEYLENKLNPDEVRTGPVKKKVVKKKAAPKKKPDQKKPAKKPATKKPAKKKAPPEQIELPDPDPVPPPLPLQIKSLEEINSSNLFLMKKTDIEKFKVFEQAMEAKMKRMKGRGLLIEREIVRLAFSRLYTVDNNELKSMEERLTGSICGIFGEADDSENSVKVQKLLNKEVTKALQHIKRIMNDFLVKQGAKKIKEKA